MHYVRDHMKRAAILLLLLAGSYAHADCQDFWLEHHSSTLYLSVGYSEGCYQGERILKFSKLSNTGPRWPSPSLRLESTPFDRECPSGKRDKGGNTIEFSCRKDGVSPLAGATYRYKQVKTTMRCNGVDEPDWDLSFICIRGCGPATPRRLWVIHGEGCS